MARGSFLNFSYLQINAEDMEKKQCQFCQQILIGRNDKKFCDDHCRSAFNNKLNSCDHRQMKNVNAVLKRNRKILAELYQAEKRGANTIFERKIQELGFVFNFHTHTETLEGGITCICCYEYGYVANTKGELAVIKVK